MTNSLRHKEFGTQVHEHFGTCCKIGTPLAPPGTNLLATEVRQVDLQPARHHSTDLVLL